MSEDLFKLCCKLETNCSVLNAETAEDISVGELRNSERSSAYGRAIVW